MTALMVYRNPERRPYMTKLICDICGTSYSDSEEKCPTCGYARAFAEEEPVEVRSFGVREKVRGGRFSKKNVRKRLKKLAEAGPKAEKGGFSPEMADMLSAEVEAVTAPQQVLPEVDVTEPVPVPAETVPVEPETAEEITEEPAAEVPVASALIEMEAVAETEEGEEEPVAEIPEEAVPVEPETVSEAETAEEIAEESAAEIPMEPVLSEQEAAEEADAVEETVEDEPVAAAVPPVPAEQEAEPEISEEESAEEEESEKAVPAVRRRNTALTAALIFFVAVFLASAVYLLLTYGLPYLKELEWPTRAVTETTVPATASTEAVTDAPTDPPTEAPTDAPTEASTEAPTEPPTEAPTKPLLDVKLELNYYDLTFGAATQITQLNASGIPNEDVTWSSDDPSIVKISSTGLITAVGGGKTTVRAVYGDQEVTVKINCPF